MKWIHGVAFAVTASAAVFAQAPAGPEFEVASIRPSAPPAANRVNVGVRIDGAQLKCSYLSLKDYIQMAYKVKIHQVSGPDWIASERFDITAKLPSGATQEQVGDMMKALLSDRFQMKMHRESKEFPVYGLVVAKSGLKIKESAEDAAPEGEEAPKPGVNVTASGGPAGTTVSLGKGSSFTLGNNRFEAKKLSMPALADTLARFTDRPVVDMTALKGNYDLAMEFSPEDFRALMIRSALAAGVALPPEAMKALDNGAGDALFTVIQTLGLKLEPRKAPQDVLVIDHITKTPTEN